MTIECDPDPVAGICLDIHLFVSDLTGKIKKQMFCPGYYKKHLEREGGQGVTGYGIGYPDGSVFSQTTVPKEASTFPETSHTSPRARKNVRSSGAGA